MVKWPFEKPSATNAPKTNSSVHFPPPILIKLEWNTAASEEVEKCQIELRNFASLKNQKGGVNDRRSADRIGL